MANYYEISGAEAEGATGTASTNNALLESERTLRSAGTYDG